MTSNRSISIRSWSSVALAACFAFGLLFIGSPSPAGNWKAAEKDHLKLDLGLVSPSFTFDIKRTLNDQTTNAMFRPNSASKTFLGFAYRNVSLGYGFTNPPEKDSVTNLGSTKSNDIQLRFIGRNSFEFAYQEYTGYYIDNSKDLDPSYQNLPSRIQRSDIQTRAYSAMYIRNFDAEDFSFTAALTQTDRHTSSGWGRFFFLGWNESFLKGDSPFIPTANASSFGDLALLKSVSQRTLLSGLGIGGILSSGKWYITSIFGLGLAGKSGTAEFEGLDPKKAAGSGAATTFRFGLGYNGEHNVFGLQAISDNSELIVGGGSLVTATMEVKLFYSHRFEGVSLPPLDWVSSFLD